MRLVISGLQASPARFTIGSLLPSLAHAAKVGTTIRFSLSEPAAVTLSFALRVGGRRIGHTCGTATPALRRRPRCARYVVITPSIRFPTARAGVNLVRFQGRLSRMRSLRPGSYRLTVTATDAAANRSAPSHILLSARARSRKH